MPTENQERLEFSHLLSRVNAGEQLTPAEKERYNLLFELFNEIRSPANPVDDQGGPDQFGYFFMDNQNGDTASFSWIELCGDNQASDGPVGDDAAVTITIGFPFSFYGTDFTSASVSTNGLISFGPEYTAFSNQCIPTFTPPNPMLFPYWDDLYAATAGGCNNDNFGPWIRYRNFGTYCVIEWSQIGHYFGPTADRYSFEAILYNNGRIKLQYNTNWNDSATPNSATIGVDAPGAGNGLEYRCDSNGASQITGGRAIWIFQAAGIPSPPTGLQAAVNGSNVTLTWLDPTTDTNGQPITIENVQVWLGPVGSGELLGTVAPGVQTLTHTGAANGFHTYNVRAFNDPYFGNPASVTILVGDFPWHPSEYEWVDITTDGTLLPLGLDEYSGALDLGFDFEFYDQTYTQLWVGSHGFVTFLQPIGFPPYIETALPNPMEPNATLYAFWDDNSSSTVGGIYYYQDVAAGRFIVSWVEVGHFISNEQYTFQVIVDADGSIKMNYHTIPINTSCTVGIENETGTDALQACFDGTGDFLPINQTAIIFFETAHAFASVSGHVTLDGGNGTAPQVEVRASGPGQRTTHPDAAGNYTLDSIATGNRRIFGSLTGYHTDTLLITLDTTGYTGADLTLRRLDPPAPTNFSVDSVNNTTGWVYLNWDNSPDPLVDSFRVYRRPESNPNWSYIRSCTASQYVDTLTVDGIYLYSVTAIDINVQPPAVESPHSASGIALYGELPPTNLVGNGNFDDRIRLTWLPPGTNNSYQLAYDDSSSEQWTNINFPNGPQDYMAVRFTPPSADSAHYPLPVQSLNVYVSATAALTTVWITPDAGGIPDIENAWGTWENVAAEGSPGWVTVNVGGLVQLTDASDFWMVWQLPPGLTEPGVGTDADFPDERSFLTWAGMYPQWAQVVWADWMARVWVGGDPGWGFVMSVGNASGYSVERLPHVLQATATASEHTDRRDFSGVSTANKSATKSAVGPVRFKAGTVARNDAITSAFAKNPFHRGLNGRIEPYSEAPALVYQGRHGGRALDDVEYYKIYRNGTFLVQDEEPPYDNLVQENVPFTYYVTAHYDNNQDSPPSNTITNVRANMAPGAPTNFSGEPVGASQMHLTWTDPAVNADGTPCVDLASVRIYREGSLIATVNAGVQSYNDTPPQPDQFYTWSVRGIDEVPNLGPEVTYYGAVVSPWQVAEYEWVDISQIGTELILSLDDYSDALDLGFEFTYFDVAYTQVYITSHGFVTFDGTFPQGAWWNETPLPNPMPPNSAIYALWDDIASSNSGAVYYYQDEAEGRFIVTYDGIGHTSNPGETYTFQIILDDRGGIRFNYQFISQTSSSAIGVENLDGTSGLQILYDGDGWLPTNESAITIWGGPAGEIAGTIRQFPSNQPIEGATVTIAQRPEFTITDASGFYSLRLDPGIYDVNFAKPGFCDTTFLNVLVEDDQTTVRNGLLRSPQAQFSVTSVSLATWPTHDVGQTFQISNNGGQCALDFTISDTSTWLSADPVSGSIAPNQAMDIWINASPNGLLPGHDYQSALRIQHEALGSPYVIPVTLSISLDAPDPNTVPTEYALYQNYPNPFNATTSIRFDVPQESHVVVTLFNVMGQAVATVVDATYEVGRHSVSYDATDLPSGMYLMKLEAGSFTSLKKMMLLK